MCGHGSVQTFRVEAKLAHLKLEIRFLVGLYVWVAMSGGSCWLCDFSVLL